MLKMQIVDIDLNMPIQDFENEIQDCINNYPEQMNYSIKSMSTRMGNHMYKLTVDNCNNSEIEIIAERDDVSGNIHFHPLKLSNMNNGFYRTNYNDTDIIGKDEDPAKFACHLLKMLCANSNYKGSFAYIEPDGFSGIIKNGSQKRVLSIALVDDDNNVYSCSSAKKIKGMSEDTSFTIKKPIAEWLQENRDVQKELMKYPTMDGKMNYIGKYLINAKINEEIDLDEFTDIFCQAGIIGFSEPSILNIYKLMM